MNQIRSCSTGSVRRIDELRKGGKRGRKIWEQSRYTTCLLYGRKRESTSRLKMVTGLEKKYIKVPGIVKSDICRVYHTSENSFLPSLAMGVCTDIFMVFLWSIIKLFPRTITIAYYKKA